MISEIQKRILKYRKTHEALKRMGEGYSPSAFKLRGAILASEEILKELLADFGTVSEEIQSISAEGRSTRHG